MRFCEAVSGGWAAMGTPLKPCVMSGGVMPGRGLPSCWTLALPAAAWAWAQDTNWQVWPGANWAAVLPATLAGGFGSAFGAVLASVFDEDAGVAFGAGVWAMA